MKQTDTLKKNYEFSLVYRKGNYFVGKYLTLYALSTNRDKKRIGITVSKKTLKKSTKRNRVKRLIKEVYRQYESDINEIKDMIFVVRKSDRLPEYNDIRKEMKYLLTLSGLITDEDKN